MVPWVCLQFGIVVFPDQTHLLFLSGAEAVYSVSSLFDLEDFEYLGDDKSLCALRIR